MMFIDKNALRFAFSFLTVMPIQSGASTMEGAGDQKKVLRCFPIVGLVIGAIVVAIDFALSSLFPPLVAAVGDVAFLAVLTGALHLDGLADSADALFSGSRDKERMLSIMKDSRIGTMGAVALILLVLLKAMSISSLPAVERWSILLAMPLAGRVAMLVMMATLDYARPGGGLGSLFGQADRLTVGLSLLLLATIVLAFNPWRIGVGMLVAWVVGLWLWVSFCRRRLGGCTGDTLGAAGELSELALLLGVFLLGRLG